MITEENIEFVDWSSIPFKSIPKKIKRKFSTSIPELKARILVEDYFSKMVKKKFRDPRINPGASYFFCDGIYWMRQDIIWGQQQFAFSDEFWEQIHQILNLTQEKREESRLFLQNVLQTKFKKYKQISGPVSLGLDKKNLQLILNQLGEYRTLKRKT